MTKNGLGMLLFTIFQNKSSEKKERKKRQINNNNNADLVSPILQQISYTKLFVC